MGGLVTFSRLPGRVGQSSRAGMTTISYSGYRFPAEIIEHAVWIYLRFTLSYRDVEELLAERGIDVSHETVRRWVMAFGPRYAQRLRAVRCKPIRIGIWTRCLSRSAARECISGAPSMPRARCSTSSCKRGEISGLPSGSCENSCVNSG